MTNGRAYAQEHSKLLPQFVFKVSAFRFNTRTKTRAPLPDCHINKLSDIFRENSRKHGVIDRAHARSVSSEFVILTVRMRTVESRKSVNDRARAHGQI